MSDAFDLILAAYPTLEAAQKDFDELVKLVKDEEGQDRRRDPGHEGRGRRGARHRHRRPPRPQGHGLGRRRRRPRRPAAPPLLAAIAVGAAAGGLIGKFAKHKVKGGLEEGMGKKLKPGMAAIVAMVDADDRLAAEQAMAGSPFKSVAPMDEGGLKGLKGALAEAAGKFNPDRTVLPIPDRKFGGSAGRTFDQSAADWSFIPGPKAPDDAPNVLIVLIDDAGFGGPDTFGGEIRTPALTRVQEMGLTYNRFHVTAVCSPTRAALLTGRNHHRVGMGGVAELPGPFPGYTGTRPRSCTALPRILRENGYVTGRLRQVAHDAGARDGRRRAVRPLADGLGLRPLVGLPDRRRRPVRPDHHPGQLDARRAPGAGRGRQALLLPGRHHRQGRRVAARGARPGRRQALVPVLLHRLRPRAASRRQGVGRQVQGPVRRRLGQVPRTHHRAPEEARHRPAGHRADRASRPVPGVGLARARPRSGCTPARWRSSPATPRTPTGTSDACSTRSRRWATSTTRWSSTSGATTAPAWRARSPARSTRRPSSTASSSRPTSRWRSSRSGAASRSWAASTPRRTSRRRGRGPTTPPSSGASRWPATWAATGTRWSSHGRSASSPTARSAVQFTHCIDVVPTILELAGIPEPTVVDGIAQEPMDGTSFAYTLDDPSAAERHTVQYFEMYGSRAIYKDGWWACAKLDKLPWDFTPGNAEDGSAPEAPGIPSRTGGSCTTCPTTSARPGTSRPRSPRSSPR